MITGLLLTIGLSVTSTVYYSANRVEGSTKPWQDEYVRLNLPEWCRELDIKFETIDDCHINATKVWIAQGIMPTPDSLNKYNEISLQETHTSITIKPTGEQDHYVYIAQPGSTSKKVCGIALEATFRTLDDTSGYLLEGGGTFKIPETANTSTSIVKWSPSADGVTASFSLSGKGNLSLGSNENSCESCNIQLPYAVASKETIEIFITATSFSDISLLVTESPLPSFSKVMISDSQISVMQKQERQSESGSVYIKRGLDFSERQSTLLQPLKQMAPGPFGTAYETVAQFTNTTTSITILTEIPFNEIGGMWELRVKEEGKTSELLQHVLIEVYTTHSSNLPLIVTNKTMTLLKYPEGGTYHILLKNQNPLKHNTFIVSLTDRLNYNCDPECSGRGSCFTDIANGGLSTALCACNRPYDGWNCRDYLHGSEFPLRFWALTLSNLAFIPVIIISFKLGRLTECSVYLGNMVASALYHACDENVAHMCFLSYDTMQFWDFFLSFGSLWFTMILMSRVEEYYTELRSVLHVQGMVGLAMGALIDRTSVWSILTPLGVAAVVILIMWIRHHYNLYDTSKSLISDILLENPFFRWKFFFPGCLLALLGFLDTQILETDDNYPITHSVWHVLIALSPAFLILSPVDSRVERKKDTVEHIDLLNDDMLSDGW